MISCTDQLNRPVILPQIPTRIVSLVPSQTELLATLGLDTEVVGITKFCVHPPQLFTSKNRIGGTKNVHLEAVAALNPHLVLANKEENVREQVLAISDQFPTWVSDINNLEQALSMIRSVGVLTGKEAAATQIVDQIATGFSQLNTPPQKRRAAYLIWKNPYMTVGGDTFIHDMMAHAGLENIFGGQQRYPSVALSEIKALQPELILLSSEPYPFKEQHVLELQDYFPEARVKLVDGELFSWYGSRLLQAPAYFTNLLSQP